MSRYHDQVAAALAAVTIRGATRYAWLGRASRPLPGSIDAQLDDSQRRSYLLSCLSDVLYVSFYCHGQPVPTRWGEPEPVFPDPRLTAALSQANAGRGSWEPGWTVQHLEASEAVIANARLRARLAVRDCRAPSGALRRGARVSVRLPKELPAVSPGFYTVVSEAPADLSSSASAVRVYWNIAAPGAPDLVATLTSRLNADAVPFRLKVANHPFRFARCDAAVLYLRGDTFHSLRDMLREAAAHLRPHLRPPIPAFTLELGPGVGLAEDKGDRESFGERRCRLLADGIVRAHEQGITQLDSQLEAVTARFAEDGVRIDAPYLEPSLAGEHVL